MATTAERKTTTVWGGTRRGNILEFYTEEFRAEPSPVPLFRQRVVQWFFAAKHLRIFEAIRLPNNPSADDLDSHRMICSALITFGEFATNYAKQNKEPLNLESVGLSIEAIEAETRLLRDNFKMFHDNIISDQEAEAVLKEAFHES
jgi:hypothetical protein